MPPQGFATSSGKRNRYSNRPKTEIVLARLTEYYDVSPEEGVIRIKKYPGTGVHKPIGTIIGVNNKGRTISIQIHKYAFYVHTLIWLYAYGQYPEHQIDHIDGNPHNNKLTNLRDVPQTLNQKNQSKRKDNSGESNIYWLKSRSRWSVLFRANNREVFRRQYKYLSDAIIARDVFLEDNPYGFTKRHGQTDHDTSGVLPTIQLGIKIL